jgi:hypothetical protein
MLIIIFLNQFLHWFFGSGAGMQLEGGGGGGTGPYFQKISPPANLWAENETLGDREEVLVWVRWVTKPSWMNSSLRINLILT